MIIDQNICPVAAHVGFVETKMKVVLCKVCACTTCCNICYSTFLQEVMTQFLESFVMKIEHSVSDEFFSDILLKFDSGTGFSTQNLGWR